MTRDAAAIVARLGFQPRPEGGWRRETHRAVGEDGGCGAVTSILFLLEAGQRSRWRRIDATELWLFHAGGALWLRTADDGRVIDFTRFQLAPAGWRLDAQA